MDYQAQYRGYNHNDHSDKNVDQHARSSTRDWDRPNLAERDAAYFSGGNEASLIEGEVDRT
jgi:hypothetical protein